jgi:hypothetical protein
MFGQNRPELILDDFGKNRLELILDGFAQNRSESLIFFKIFFFILY